MAANLIELMSKALTPDLLQSLTRFAGEDEGAVRTGMGALLPVLIGGLANKASVSGGPANVFSMVNGPGVDTGLLATLSNLLGGNQSGALLAQGSTLLTGLFGTKAAGLGDALASLTGMTHASAGNLLAVAAPWVFGWLKKYVADRRLDASGLAMLLLGQKEHLAGQVDPKLTSALGFASPGGWLSTIGAGFGAAASTAGSTVETAARATAASAGAAAATAGGAAVAASSGLARWLPWLIAAAIALILLTQLGQCSTADKTPAPAATAPAVAPVPAPTAVPATTPVTLPAKVYFTTGKADIGPDGASTIQAVAAMLVKDGASQVDLTGYTDKTGDSAANEELAKNRALAVRDALVAAGVGAGRIGTRPPMFVETGAGGADNEARRVDITAR